MYIYFIVLLLIMLNGAFFGNKRKWFISSSFGLIILLSALRKFTVGIDLSSHYANRFITIANLKWIELPIYQTKHTYDLGFIIFDKIISCISDNPQWFIIVTSIIIFGSVARYIYRHSENIVIETFLFITSFTMMMYLNIIAQSLAIAIMLFGFDFLLEKKYFRFVCIVLLATTIHSSAIVCLCFIPLIKIPNKKKYIIRYIIVLCFGTLFLDQIISLLTNTIFKQFSVYFDVGSYHGAGIDVSANSIFQISMHFFALFLASFTLFKDGEVSESNLLMKNKYSIKLLKKVLRKKTISQIPTNFLIYMSVAAVVFRILVYQSYIFSRMGFYIYFFSFTLISRSVENIEDSFNQKFIKASIYLYMFFMFILFYESAGINSYGVLPYRFFWQLN